MRGRKYVDCGDPSVDGFMVRFRGSRTDRYNEGSLRYVGVNPNHRCFGKRRLLDPQARCVPACLACPHVELVKRPLAFDLHVRSVRRLSLEPASLGDVPEDRLGRTVLRRCVDAAEESRGDLADR